MASDGKQNTKKKVQYVPSRYKQSAEKRSAMSNCREKSTFLKVSSNVRGRVNESSYDSSSSSSKLVVSQECHGMTSTPASKGDFPFPHLDASVVTDVKGCLTLPPLKEGIGVTKYIPASNLKRSGLKKKKFHNDTMISHGPVVACRVKDVNEHYDKKVTEAHIDLLYTEYLQSASLDYETKETLEKRSSCATEKIHRLFCLVMLHMEKLQTEQCQTGIISYFLKTFEHCQKQGEIYKPLLDIVPSLKKQYRSLAEAVNATKHKLHIKNILLPELGSEDELIELLDETNNTISEFFKTFKNGKEICMSTEILQNYIDVGEKIADSLKRGSELLTEAQDLVLSEATLELSRISL